MRWLKAFFVAMAEPAGKGTWIVKGRAFVDIDLGDALYVREIEGGASPVSEGFIVEEIVTYRRKVPSLCMAMTGDLKLRGEHGDRLVGAGTLYKQATT